MEIESALTPTPLPRAGEGKTEFRIEDRRYQISNFVFEVVGEGIPRNAGLYVAPLR